MTNNFERWRDSFLQHVQDADTAAPLKAAAMTGDLKSWTSRLTTAIVRSSEAVGWRAAGKGHPLDLLPQIGQEYLGIDVIAFAGTPSHRWPLPIAAFELENHAKDDRVAYSLWKVLALRIGMRIVFAYRPDAERGRRLVTRLTEDVIAGLSPDERAAIGGQTALAIGNRGEGETFPFGYFKFWMLDTNLGRFEKV